MRLLQARLLPIMAGSFLFWLSLGLCLCRCSAPSEPDQPLGAERRLARADSIVISGIQRAIRLQSQYNIQVINLSLGRPIFESYTVDPLCQAVEAALEGRYHGGGGRRKRRPR